MRLSQLNTPHCKTECLIPFQPKLSSCQQAALHFLSSSSSPPGLNQVKRTVSICQCPTKKKNCSCFSYLVQALVRTSKDFLCLKMSDKSTGQQMPYCPEQMSTSGFAGSYVYKCPLCNYATFPPGFTKPTAYKRPLCSYAMSPPGFTKPTAHKRPLCNYAM